MSSSLLFYPKIHESHAIGKVFLFRVHRLNHKIKHGMEAQSGSSLFPIIHQGDIASVKKSVAHPTCALDESDPTSGQTPLIYAAAESQEIIVDILVAAGANVNAQDGHHRSALSYAAAMGLIRSVEVLVTSDAVVDQLDNKKRTPLHYAAQGGHTEVIHYLLQAGADIYATDAWGMTPLMRAVKAAHVEAVNYLLGMVSKLNQKEEKTGRTVLQMAAAGGVVELVESILAAGADVNDKDHHGRTALMTAVVNHRKEVVQVLPERGAEIDDMDQDGNTALHLAAALGAEEIIEILLSFGKVTVDAKNAEGDTALIVAGKSGKFGDEATSIKVAIDDLYDITETRVKGVRQPEDETETVVENTTEVIEDGQSKVRGFKEEDYGKVTLVEGEREAINGGKSQVKGKKEEFGKIKLVEGKREVIDTDSRTKVKGKFDQYDEEVTVVKANANHEEVVKMLIKSGAKINEANAKGQTSLMHACASESVVVVKALVEAGADLGCVDASNPILNLALKGHAKLKPGEETPKKLNIQEEIQKINAATVNERNQQGQTRLIIASARGSVDTVRALIERGSDVNTKDFKGFTSVMGAAAAGHTEIVELLLNSGAEVDAKNSQGLTALALAVANGHLAAAKKLIEADARVEFKIKGLTLLMLAASRGYSEIVELLVERGADANQTDFFGKTAMDYAKGGNFNKLAKFLESHTEEKTKRAKPAGTGRRKVRL
jgi:ankyrin repeat protein